MRLVQIRGPSRSRRRVRARDAGPAEPPAVPRRDRQWPSGPVAPGRPEGARGLHVARRTRSLQPRGAFACGPHRRTGRSARATDPEAAPEGAVAGPLCPTHRSGPGARGSPGHLHVPPKGPSRWPVSSVRRRRPDPRPKPWAWDALLSFASPSAYRAAESHLWRVCLTHLVASSGFFDLSTPCSLCDRPGLSHPGAAPGVFTLQRFSPAGSRTPFGSSCPS